LFIELTIAVSEYMLELVSFSDSDEVVGIPDVQMSEDLVLNHSIK
jgi:hypothetical protein